MDVQTLGWLCFCWALLLARVATTATNHAPYQVHLQWTLCEPNIQSVLEKLDISGQDPYKENPITYYDTYPPRYAQRGLGFRTKVKHHEPVSLIKIRHPEEISDIPDAADCVWDTYGDTTSFTCAIQSALQGTTPWSKEQVSFVERYQAVNWDSLVAYGSYPNAKWRVDLGIYPAVFDDVVAGSLHLMEVEVKVALSDGDNVYRAVDQHLRDIGVRLCEQQEPKTLRLFRSMFDHPGGEEL